MQTLTVTVIPCGREDMSDCGPEELPYELTLPRQDQQTGGGGGVQYDFGEFARRPNS